MITLPASESQAYCLTIAQIIPVFLIALFVLNNPQFTKKAKKLQKINKKLEKEGQDALAKHKDFKSQLISQLVQIDSILIGLDIEGSISITKSKALARAELTKMRLEVESAYKDYVKSRSDLEKKLDSAPETRAKLRVAHANGLLDFARSVLLNIALGVAGEVLALWSAIGIVSPRFGIAWTTDLTILIIGFLSSIAVGRLAPAASPKSYNTLLYIWVISTIILAQASYVYVLLALKITR